MNHCEIIVGILIWCKMCDRTLEREAEAAAASEDFTHMLQQEEAQNRISLLQDRMGKARAR